MMCSQEDYMQTMVAWLGGMRIWVPNEVQNPWYRCPSRGPSAGSLQALRRLANRQNGPRIP